MWVFVCVCSCFARAFLNWFCYFSQYDEKGDVIECCKQCCRVVDDFNRLVPALQAACIGGRRAGEALESEDDGAAANPPGYESEDMRNDENEPMGVAVARGASAATSIAPVCGAKAAPRECKIGEKRGTDTRFRTLAAAAAASATASASSDEGASGSARHQPPSIPLRHGGTQEEVPRRRAGVAAKRKAAEVTSSIMATDEGARRRSLAV
jgi:hypothetical protein